MNIIRRVGAFVTGKVPRMVSLQRQFHDPHQNSQGGTSDISGRNNRINVDGASLVNVIVRIKGNNNTVNIGEGSRLNQTEIYIRGNNNNIDVGAKCRMIKGGSLWVEDNHCRLRIGTLTSFISAHLAVTESGSSIVIGDDCMFAYDIDVRTGDSHSILDASTGVRINPASDVVIGDHVWVASHARILKGVRIMNNCIIATGSVVVKGGDDENVIYAGNPARIVKRNIGWCRERI